MKQYTSSAVVDAVQWTGNNLDKVYTLVPSVKPAANNRLFMVINYLPRYAAINDYIIRHSNGKIDIRNSDVFANIYTEVLE